MNSCKRLQSPSSTLHARFMRTRVARIIPKPTRPPETAPATPEKLNPNYKLRGKVRRVVHRLIRSREVDLSIIVGFRRRLGWAEMVASAFSRKSSLQKDLQTVEMGAEGAQFGSWHPRKNQVCVTLLEGTRAIEEITAKAVSCTDRMRKILPFTFHWVQP